MNYYHTSISPWHPRLIKSIIKWENLPTRSKNSQPEVVEVSKSRSCALQQLNLGVYPFYCSAGKADAKVIQDPAIPTVQCIQKVFQDLDPQSLYLLLPLIESHSRSIGSQTLVFINIPKLFLPSTTFIGSNLVAESHNNSPRRHRGTEKGFSLYPFAGRNFQVEEGHNKKEWIG
jgi:hypothetical protein